MLDLVEFMNEEPESLLPREARPRLKLGFLSLDQLLFVDETSELAVDRETLIRIASDKDLTSPSVRDILLVETSKYVGLRIKSFKQGKRISWQDAETYGVPIDPPSREDIDSMGFGPTEDLVAIERAVRAQFRDREIPEFWIEPNSATLADRITDSLLVNQSVWSCLVANLGFWAALNVVGTHIIAGIMLVSGVPWQVVLKWLIVFTGANTAYFILQCIVNPRYRA